MANASDSPDSNAYPESACGIQFGVSGKHCATSGIARYGKESVMTVPEHGVRKLGWVDYTYYGACLVLMGYTVWLMYSIQEGNMGKLRLLRVADKVCKRTAETVGQWGMSAEAAYHRIIESERMN